MEDTHIHLLNNHGGFRGLSYSQNRTPVTGPEVTTVTSPRIAYLALDGNDDIHRKKSFLSKLRYRNWRNRFSGWRGGTLVCIIICAVVLLVNLLLLIVALASWPLSDDGIATAYTGNCAVAARQSLVAHFFINLLSSLLLGVSNYCMQRLVAPTRKEIDAAHARREWLDIGALSLRNLFFISRSRTRLWIILGLSSVPLHFMYNSAVFSTVSANVVSFHHNVSATTIASLSSNSRNTYANLTNAECHEVYNSRLISNYGSGWGMLSPGSPQIVQPPFENDGLGQFGLQSTYSYCISEITQPQCQVQMSMIIIGIVICVNSVKLFVVGRILWRFDYETIVTTGDAIQSFLQEPDLTTRGHCLLSTSNIDAEWRSGAPGWGDTWRQRRRPQWSMACSSRRWLLASLFTASAIIPATLFLIRTNLARNSTLQKTWNGLGHVSPNHLVVDAVNTGGNMILPTVLIVNAPQFIISFLYLLYNGLFTCMLTGREWTQYAAKRASLRVTCPLPGQRATYFLQLPYRWSIPLLTASTLLHWLVSQSIFLARVAFYSGGKPWTDGFERSDGRWKPASARQSSKPTNNEGADYMALFGNVLNGIGYSDIGLVASLSFLMALIIVCRILAMCRTFPKGLPSCGTNSAIISAACHVVDNDGEKPSDGDIVQQPLQWGVTIRGSEEVIGHLCFSDGEVEQPEFNCKYAGVGPTTIKK